MKAVSVIIPCYNEEKTIVRVLDAIYQQTFPCQDIEVIIADGFSLDGTRPAVAAYQTLHPDLRVTLVDNPSRNIPAGLNTALKHATGELIIRMDGHSIPDVDYVATCVRDHEAGLGDNVGGVWIIEPGGKGRAARSIAAAAAHPLGVGDAGYRLNSPAGSVDTVPFGSYRRELFDRLGGYDETLLSNEDYEMNARIRTNGGTVYLDPRIRCTYFARASFGKLVSQYFRYGFWKYQMLLRYPATIRWRQALPPVFVLSLVGLGLFSIFWPIFRYLLALEITAYVGIIVAASLVSALKKKDIGLLAGMPVAITCMHLAWGSGFLFSMVKSLFQRHPASATPPKGQS